MIRALLFLAFAGDRIHATRAVRRTPPAGAAVAWPEPARAGGSHGFG